MVMDDMKSVVLEVKEGRGFENIRQDIILQADLDGVISKTLPAHSTRDGNVYFNNELVWEIQKKYLRRMKICLTPLKIECYAITNHDKKNRVGYLSLKLKSIKEVKISEDADGEWFKLLGVTSEGKQSVPSVFLKFYVQDSQMGEGIVGKKTESILPVEYLPGIKPVLTPRKGLIQIGPVDAYTDNFALGIKLTKMKNLNLLHPEGSVYSGGYVFLYTLLGYDIRRDPFKDLSLPTPQEKMVIKLKSTLPTLKLYLETNPYLTVRLMYGEKVLGYSQADLRLLIPEEGVTFLPSSLENHLILLSPANELASIKDGEPYIDILLTFDLLGKLDDNSINAPPSLVSQMGDHSNLGHVIDLEKAEPVKKHAEEPISSLPPVNHMKNIVREITATGNEDTTVRDQNTAVKAQNACVVPNLDESLAYKVVQELEDWKEMQKEIFIDKVRKKEKQHLDLLSSEWLMKREHLENNLSQVISQNHTLMSSLKEAIADLQERKNRVAEKEKRLKFIKDDMERRYNLKLQDLQAASKRMEDDCFHQVELLETQKKEQDLKYLELQGENLTLKEKIKEQEAEIANLTKGSLTKDQTASLLTEVKSFQEKLDIADQSKIFFKQQWAKAVREIHRLKTEHQESLQIQIKHNKEELRQLGLSQTAKSDCDTGNEEPRLPGHIQKLIERRNEMSESGDAIESSRSKIRIPRTLSAVSSGSSADEKLQSLIEERNSLLRTGSYTIEDVVVTGLNQQIRSLMTTCGGTI